MVPSMQTEWRAISGPVLITVVSLAALAADQAYSGFPNPAPLQVCIVAVAAALAGLGSGLVSAVIAVMANPSSAATALMSAWMPAPPPESEPAMISTRPLMSEILRALSWAIARSKSSPG